MSATQRDAAPAYSEAEKGTMDSEMPRRLEFAYPKDEKKDLYPDEKKDLAQVSALPVAELTKEKDTPAAVNRPKPAPKPKKKVSKWILWQLWFNTYRKLFTIAFSLNMIGLGLAASGHWPYAVKYQGAIVTANFNFAILMRNEIFGRLLYLFVNTFFAKWTPLKWRLGCTSVLQHLGGIHSGCAVSGIAWLLYQVITVYGQRPFEHTSLLVIGVITNITVFLTACAAIPWVRNTHHNVFERHHRFVGWTGLFLTWSFTLLTDIWEPATQTWNLNGVHFVRQQNFWFVLGMTTFIALPWICTREVPVDIELPSPKVAIVRFRRGMQQGLLGRISRSAVKEYHAFGIISEGTHAKYHYLICGVQGDFTRSLVNDPPKTLWTRELKFAGVSNTSTLYKRGIRICTGTGIGAALSTCIQSPYWYLIWIGSDQEKTFGPTISGLIHRHIEPERLLLWDSKVRGGRPDTMKILSEVYHSWQAEVVFITSNYIGNSEMMQGCKEAGIPCFGTLWDF
ncbi:hypothetical protein PsYK624_029490 [Phanerochaete sordida]|uniref:Non-ribosomal peptide synthetase n=1 Tax=Phanerochaete sordida TaxID=48140 RepID=A0A9P3G259_9APHY|nr:hypothetical protein PsYK624_029490 [Phanerochaete sordida]